MALKPFFIPYICSSTPCNFCNVFFRDVSSSKHTISKSVKLNDIKIPIENLKQWLHQLFYSIHINRRD